MQLLCQVLLEAGQVLVVRSQQDVGAQQQLPSPYCQHYVLFPAADGRSLLLRYLASREQLLPLPEAYEVSAEQLQQQDKEQKDPAVLQLLQQQRELLAAGLAGIRSASLAAAVDVQLGCSKQRDPGGASAVVDKGDSAVPCCHAGSSASSCSSAGGLSGTTSSSMQWLLSCGSHQLVKQVLQQSTGCWQPPAQVPPQAIIPPPLPPPSAPVTAAAPVGGAAGVPGPDASAEPGLRGIAAGMGAAGAGEAGGVRAFSSGQYVTAATAAAATGNGWAPSNQYTGNPGIPHAAAASTPITTTAAAALHDKGHYLQEGQLAAQGHLGDGTSVSALQGSVAAPVSGRENMHADTGRASRSSTGSRLSMGNRGAAGGSGRASVGKDGPPARSVMQGSGGGKTGGASTRNRGRGGRGGHMLVPPEASVARPALRLSAARHE